MKAWHEINVIQCPHNSYVKLQAWLVMQAWPCNLNECDGLLRREWGGVGDGKRIRVVWLSLSMTICTENQGGRLTYYNIWSLVLKKRKLQRNWLGIFWVNFRRINAVDYFPIDFKDHRRKADPALSTHSSYYRTWVTIALFCDWLTNLKIPTQNL